MPHTTSPAREHAPVPGIAATDRRSRFEIHECLGRGGGGSVYVAYDRQRDETVALKTLTHLDAPSLYRLKQEFRTVADLAHPNLVSLYELVYDDETWLFTMELIQGVSLLEYVRPHDRVDEHRLRVAFAQVVRGVAALHRGSIIHRDLKPSNILVSRTGRAVVLDFGVARPAAEDDTQTGGFAGSIAYAAPEQGAGGEIGAACDCYALGVILYECLAGVLPFPGATLQTLLDKQRQDPRPLTEVVPEAPSDLADLAMRLLARDPAARPSTAALEAFCDGMVAPGGRDVGDPHEVEPLVGRAAALATLDAALAQARAGEAVSVYVHGPSGIGKTALVQRFLARARDEAGAVVLAGRCYERESVPYKALDGLIDNLSRYLTSLPPARAGALMPRDVAAVVRLFPVLDRAPAVAHAPHRVPPSPDPWVQRRRAFAALRELLARIGDRAPLVLFIDDLHWADADSTVLLEDLLRSPDAPALLLVASFRGEEVATTPFLRTLLERTGTTTCREIGIGPISDDDARALAAGILGAAAAPLRLDAIVREAAGSPFLVDQLARHALMAGDEASAAPLSLGELVAQRVRLLPEGAEQLLQAVVVNGRPIDPAVAVSAVGLTGDERPLVAALRAARLVRTTGTAARIDVYHDRIRETVARRLPETLVRTVHQRLAHVLEARGSEDADALFGHHLGAGDHARAAIYAARAAEKAAAALAFDRAALFYRRALEIAGGAPHERLPLEVALGDALVNAGRSAEAAAVFLAAATRAPHARAVDLRRRAAEQLLMSGHIDRGLDGMARVLGSVGLSLAHSPRSALLRLLARRIQLKCRGVRFRERTEAELPSATLLEIDTCWGVAVGLGLVNSIRGAEFQTLHLLLALRAGEPYRIARALAVEAGFSSSPGATGRRRAERYLRAAAALSERVDRPHATGLTQLMSGIAAYCTGGWRRAATCCEDATRIFQRECTAVVWELTSAQRFFLSALAYLGELGEVSARLPGLLAAAVERGNLYGATDLRTRLNIVWLAADDPAGARREVDEALAAWSNEGFHLQHYSALLARTQADLYARDTEAAWRRLDEAWQPLARSMLLHVQVLRVEALHLRARAALQLAEETGDARRRHLAVARRFARRIAREHMPWSDSLVALVEAGVRTLTGDRRAAGALLREAIDGFARADMHLHAHVARRRLGAVVGGREGTGMIDAADEWLAAQRIVRPDRMTAMLAPGFDGA